jgi:hypothetical protein
MKTAGIRELLGSLESVSAALRIHNYVEASRRLGTVLDSLRSRSLDAVERMVLNKVVWRIHETWRAAEGPVCLALAIDSLELRVRVA